MLSMHRLAPPALAFLLAAGPLFASEPRSSALEALPAKTAVHPNQHLANAVAQELRASGQLRSYRIDVLCHQGTVELSGIVRDSNMRDEAARLAQGVPGVDRVINRLRAAATGQVARAEYAASEPAAPRPTKVEPEANQVEQVPAPRKIDGDLQMQEPLPSFRAILPGPGPMPGGLPAPMPPYAWPSYAPYNNYSRVAYPQAYPCEAFPCIGPFYPFPKVPLNWRKVTLEWDDGHWWLQTHGQKKDWWVIRYW